MEKTTHAARLYIGNGARLCPEPLKKYFPYADEGIGKMRVFAPSNSGRTAFKADTMKPHFVFVRLGMLILLAMIMFLSGCASTEIPLASTPPLYSQEKLQSVDHWDNVADRVAMRVQKTLEDRRDLVNKPIYVKPPNDRPFSLAFYELLRTRLVSKGMQVSAKPEPGGMILDYDVLVVVHNSSRREWLPGLSNLGIGVANLFTGEYTSASKHEIVINARILDGNRFAMHVSHIHYIDDDEWQMYFSPESMDPLSQGTRNVHITNR